MEEGCDLECVKLPKIREFVAPVKIILEIPSKKDYILKIWGAASVALAFFLMGATTMTVIFFTLNFVQGFDISLHIFLCTTGIFLPIGVFNLNPLSGPAAVMTAADRRLEHVIVQIVGLACSAAGSYMVFYKFDFSITENLFTVHCFSGLLAGYFSALGVLIGPLAFFIPNKSCIRTAHSFCGVMVLVLSTICFVSGILKVCMWFRPTTVGVSERTIFKLLIVLCVSYNLIAIFTPVSKWFSR